MYLRNYLAASGNMTSREELLMHRTVYDLKLAVAQSGHTLICSKPDVDRDGYDLKMTLGEDHHLVQCKTVGPGPGATSWKMHRNLLAPKAEEVSARRIRGLNPSSGLGGGLLVAQISLADEQAQRPGGQLDVTYQYLDLLTLWALAMGLVRKARDVQKDAKALLESFIGDETRVAVPRRLLVQANNTACLVALMGLEGIYPPHWRANLGHLWSDLEPGDDLDAALQFPGVREGIGFLQAYCTDLVGQD